jgi:hypothetical protein
VSQLRWLSFVGLMVVVLAGCGDDKRSKEDRSSEAELACTSMPVSAADTAPRLPAKFPTFDSVTYTVVSTQGPTEIIDGYYKGDVAAAHDEVKSALESAGFTILFDELEEDDSEVSWKGQGRSGQVALRMECGDEDKTFVHITNRPE